MNLEIKSVTSATTAETQDDLSQGKTKDKDANKE